MLWFEGEPADEVYVVVADFRERLGGCVGLEAEVAYDLQDVLDLLGGVGAGGHGGADEPGGAGGVGGDDRVDRLIQFVLGQARRRMLTEQVAGAAQGCGDVGFEVGLVGEEVPPVDGVVAGKFPGVECAAVGVVVEGAWRVESCCGAGAV